MEDTNKNFVSIDAGLLTKENANYLYNTGIIDEKGHILYRPIKNSGFDRPVQVWSMFCLVKDDITETTGLKDLNAIVDVMREGLFEEDRKYPKITDFIQKGTQLVFEKRSGRKGSSKSKEDVFDFDD